MHTLFDWFIYAYLGIGLWRFLLSITIKKRSVSETVKLIDKNGLVFYD